MNSKKKLRRQNSEKLKHPIYRAFYVFLLFVNTMALTLFLMDYMSLPLSVSLLITFCILLIICCKFVPTIIAQLQPAKPCPYTLFSFIFMALSKAIIQHFALHTTPCGKHACTSIYCFIDFYLVCVDFNNPVCVQCAVIVAPV